MRRLPTKVVCSNKQPSASSTYGHGVKFKHLHICARACVCACVQQIKRQSWRCIRTCRLYWRAKELKKRRYTAVWWQVVGSRPSVTFISNGQSYCFEHTQTQLNEVADTMKEKLSAGMLCVCGKMIWLDCIIFPSSSHHHADAVIKRDLLHVLLGALLAGIQVIAKGIKERKNADKILHSATQKYDKLHKAATKRSKYGCVYWHNCVTKKQCCCLHKFTHWTALPLFVFHLATILFQGQEKNYVRQSVFCWSK